MNKILTRTVAAAALAASGAVLANEIVVTPVLTGSGKLSMAFDMATEGGVAGFNFKVSLPGLSDKAGRVANCVAELPTGFEGACSIIKGGVYVYAISNSPDVTLPVGVVNIGTVSIEYPAIEAKIGTAFEPEVEELAVFDSNAKALTATARVEMDGIRGGNLTKPGARGTVEK